MAKFINDAVMDAALDEIATADKMTACTQQPLTYYEGVDAAAWLATQAYVLGDAARPVTRNGYCYEVTTAGTSGASEPTWPTTPGNTVVDGTVTWTCRNNYAVTENAALTGGDFTKANGDTNGRKVTVASKAGINIHTSGTVDHVALVDDTDKSVQAVTTCTSQALTAGGTVTFPAFDDEIADAA